MSELLGFSRKLSKSSISGRDGDLDMMGEQKILVTERERDDNNEEF